MVCKKIRDKHTKGTIFCFTDYSINNLTSGYDKVFDEYKDLIRGIAWGTEICPKTFARTGVEKQHNQGFIQLFSQGDYKQIQKWFRSKCHFEICHGSIEQNENYCAKDGFYKKLGYFCTQGYKTDFHNIKVDLKNGATEYDIMENYTPQFMRYHGGISKMKSLIDKKLAMEQGYRNLEITALIGPSRSGKSSYVFNKYGYKNVFKISPGSSEKFLFDGYDGEDVILIDEFNGYIKYSYLLDICDGHPISLNVKNGKTYGRFTKIFFTSNSKPCYWYKSISDNFKNRLATILEVSKGNTKALTPILKPLVNPWLKTDEYCNEYDSEDDY